MANFTYESVVNKFKNVTLSGATKGKKEKKPILLSIGYASCHWCHVMAHESFEDNETAKIMNDYFINVKVDREERPDVDSIYMTSVQIIAGHGGWPMSSFLTPDRKPFFAGTYFPKEGRHGLPSFMEVLKKYINTVKPVTANMPIN